jgi:hypothetical protein
VVGLCAAAGLYTMFDACDRREPLADVLRTHLAEG